MARLCPHNIDLTQFNCEDCAAAFRTPHPDDKKKFPEDPVFRVHNDGTEWVCELDNYTGKGTSIGRAIDAAITVGLGFGRGPSVKRWVKTHYYSIAAISTEVEPEEEQQ